MGEDLPLRKISVGADPKNAMHYIVDGYMGLFKIRNIARLSNGKLRVFVSVDKHPNSLFPWKTFNPNTTPITEEHYIEIE